MSRSTSILVGLAVGGALLWLVFRSADVDVLLASLGGANGWWLAASQIPICLSFVTRIWRWAYIVCARRKVGFWPMFASTQIGFLANYTLPLRVGELIRAFLLGRLAKMPTSEGLAMVALDRVTDIIGLVGVMLVAAYGFPLTTVNMPTGTLGNKAPLSLSSEMIGASVIFTWVFLLSIVVTLVGLYFRRQWVIELSNRILGLGSERLATAIGSILERFADGLHVFSSPVSLVKVIGLSWVTWALFLAHMYCILMAFDLAGSWYTTFVVLSSLAVVQSAPGAPGFVGQFHFGVVVGVLLVSPQTDPNHAKAMAIMAHALTVLPVAVVGFYCLAKENIGLLEISREARSSPEAA